MSFDYVYVPDFDILERAQFIACFKNIQLNGVHLEHSDNGLGLVTVFGPRRGELPCNILILFKPNCRKLQDDPKKISRLFSPLHVLWREDNFVFGQI